MKVSKIIKIHRTNIAILEQLDCVEYVKHRSDGIMVKLKEEYTNGSTILHAGDSLVKFENGLYQRFGSESMQRLIKTP